MARGGGCLGLRCRRPGGYDYDGAGNLRQVRQQQAATLSITGLASSRGGAGQAVVISGVGFSPIASQNVVRLSGTPAAVTWATPSELGVVVPAGAGTGRFTVTVGAASATSPSDFTVVIGVEVADFTPKWVGPGRSSP